MRTGVLMIDMQNFFFEENAALVDTRLAQNCAELLDRLRELSVPLIHVRTVYEKDKSDWPIAWRNEGSGIWCEHLTMGSHGVDFVQGLEPHIGEEVVRKTRFSSFFRTRLHGLLQEKDIDTLIIAGYSCDVCVRFTSVDAYNYGYRVVLATDCVEAFKEDTDKAVEYLKWATNIETKTSEQIIQSLRDTFIHQ